MDVEGGTLHAEHVTVASIVGTGLTDRLRAGEETRLLADRHEADAELERAYGSEDEPARLDTGDLRHGAAEGLDERCGDAAEHLRVVEEPPHVGVPTHEGDLRGQRFRFAERS